MSTNESTTTPDRDAPSPRAVQNPGCQAGADRDAPSTLHQKLSPHERAKLDHALAIRVPASYKETYEKFRLKDAGVSYSAFFRYARKVRTVARLHHLAELTLPPEEDVEKLLPRFVGQHLIAALAEETISPRGAERLARAYALVANVPIARIRADAMTLNAQSRQQAVAKKRAVHEPDNSGPDPAPYGRKDDGTPWTHEEFCERLDEAVWDIYGVPPEDPQRRKEFERKGRPGIHSPIKDTTPDARFTPKESRSGHRPDKPMESRSGHRPDKPMESRSGHRPDKPIPSPSQGESRSGHRPDKAMESRSGHRPDKERRSGHRPDEAMPVDPDSPRAAPAPEAPAHAQAKTAAPNKPVVQSSTLHDSPPRSPQFREIPPNSTHDLPTRSRFVQITDLSTDPPDEIRHRFPATDDEPLPGG